MEKREPSYTVGENVNWCSHYGEQNGGSLKKLKMPSQMVYGEFFKTFNKKIIPIPYKLFQETKK